MSIQLLPLQYFPTHADNRMRNEGDLASARQSFLSQRFRNLDFLLRQRYEWMNTFLVGRKSVVELGSGAGFSREYLETRELRLTDVNGQPWIDETVDALNLPYERDSLDAVVCSHMIHHLAQPRLFFENLRSRLRPGGIVIIQDIWTSFSMRVLLRLMRHEGWSYKVNVFSDREIANDPADPWSANCAIPELLFGHPQRFEREFPGLKVKHFELGECMIFPISGGVISKTRVPELPLFALKLLHRLDQVLTRLAPSIFAMGCSVVLEKQGVNG